MKKQKKINWVEITKNDILNYMDSDFYNRKYINTAWVKCNSNCVYHYLIYLTNRKNETVFNKQINMTLTCIKKLSQYKLDDNKEYIAKQILIEYKKLRLEEEFK